MYQVGKEYRWQNQKGEFTHLNGTICTVIASMKMRRHPLGFHLQAWETDTPWPYKGRMSNMVAFRGDLAPSNGGNTLVIKEENAVLA